jgi:hypothetical protein
MSNDRVSCCIVLEYLVELLLQSFHGAVDDLHLELAKGKAKRPPRNDAPVNTSFVSYWKDEKELVNHVVGWAVDSVFGQIKRGEDKPLKKRLLKHGDEISQVINLLDTMCISHYEALGNEEYMKNCYSLSDQIINRGGLKLISPAFFECSKVLVRENEYFDKKILERKGKDSIKWAYERLLQNASIRSDFLVAMKTESEKCDIRVSEECMVALYDALATKVFHALVGNKTTKIVEELVGRKTEKNQNVAFRVGLQVLSRRGGDDIVKKETSK